MMARATCIDWEDIIVSLCLRGGQEVCEEIGVNGQVYNSLHRIASRLLAEARKACPAGSPELRRSARLGEIDFKWDLPDRLVRELGSSSLATTVQGWADTLWSRFEEQARDWYAYQMVFSQWYGKLRHAGVDILGLTRSATLLQAYDELFVQRNARFHGQIDAARADLTRWNADILDWSRRRLGDPWSEESLDLASTWREACSRRYFQTFWPHFAALGTDDHGRVHQKVESIVREAQAYPENRILPMPSELIPSPYLTVAVD
jgi:hypothetical protein